MANGASFDPAEEAKKLVQNPVETIASAIVNVTTAGTVGYSDGKFVAGANVRAVDETVGEVSGRNAARKAAMQSQDAIKEAKAAAEKERLGQIQMQEAKDRQASAKAAAASKKTQTGVSAGTGTSGIEQQLAVDFLGL